MTCTVQALIVRTSGAEVRMSTGVRLTRATNAQAGLQLIRTVVASQAMKEIFRSVWALDYAASRIIYGTHHIRQSSDSLNTNGQASTLGSIHSVLGRT